MKSKKENSKKDIINEYEIKTFNSSNLLKKEPNKKRTKIINANDKLAENKSEKIIHTFLDIFKDQDKFLIKSPKFGNIFYTKI